MGAVVQLGSLDYSASHFQRWKFTSVSGSIYTYALGCDWLANRANIDYRYSKKTAQWTFRLSFGLMSVLTLYLGMYSSGQH
jgi:hypothetical protein